MTLSVRILGSRGVPGAHGGFETLAERLALYLVGKGWSVTVYCQEQSQQSGAPESIQTDYWRGIRRVRVPVARSGPFGTILFDWRSTYHAAQEASTCLVLGHNTSIMSALLKGRVKILTNMDGMEWVRPKWPLPIKAWFHLNAWMAVAFSDMVIADHPELKKRYARYLPRKPVTVITYGADEVIGAVPSPLEQFGVEPDKYFISVARVEPDNHILNFVRVFSGQRRGRKLLVLGTLSPDQNSYHAEILRTASDEVVFPGAIYDQSILKSLRFHCRAYFHRHMAGGVNPSLVEALWCGNAVLAHRNKFNVWTAGPNQFFFSTEKECAEQISRLIDDDSAVEVARISARERAREYFRWDAQLEAYETILMQMQNPKHSPERDTHTSPESSDRARSKSA